MNAMKLAVATVVVLAGFLAASAWAATAAKAYQVTGPVLAVDDTKIVVETKDGEKWEIAKSADAKGLAEVKVGDKVTIKYRMVATGVEMKGDGAGAAGREKAEPAQEVRPATTPRK